MKTALAGRYLGNTKYMSTFNRRLALPNGHRLYTSPNSLKQSPWLADNDNYNSRGKPCAWPSEPGNWLTSRSLPRTIAQPEPETDRQYWFGSVAANDNRPGHRWEGESNCGPDADYIARKANPGTSRDYEGDIFSRLVADAVDGDRIKDADAASAALVLRAVSSLLAPAGMTAANDNGAEDADAEMGDGFGLDYAMEQDRAEKAIETYEMTGKLPNGTFKFRVRSGCGGAKLMAKHRAEEKKGLHVDRYIALRGVAALPEQKYRSDGEEPWWRSHAPKNADAAAALATACDRTNWNKVTWTRYAPMPARVYGALGIHSEMKGTGSGKASAPQHSVVHEIVRQHAENEFRMRMPERAMHIIDAAIQRQGYTKISETEGLSRNGAKFAVKAALRQAWDVLSDITGEKMPKPKENLAA
ncbi:hypothetical protein [Mesorhizobium sp.]|uniref:hypothetical protein n=1 Tax=Mesorhizobium sp. TaxID=1871066 RepID=UPI00120CE99F|nr:hypothetical protein [Mesorhizobium sp.]TIQ42533.1 MAG: hypothetical protein E5X47_31785 [Mesorhizobium sp.]TIQ54844.1 MAG: hypothetical protein E5X46_25550 [Mesorhizobium sp.]